MLAPVGMAEDDGAEQPPAVRDAEAARELALSPERPEYAAAEAGVDRSEQHGHDAEGGI